jgi:pimeloyl-ACP methyl ester carboxylesterase
MSTVSDGRAALLRGVATAVVFVLGVSTTAGIEQQNQPSGSALDISAEPIGWLEVFLARSASRTATRSDNEYEIPLRGRIESAQPPPAQGQQKPADAPKPSPPRPLTAKSPDGTKIICEVTGSGPALMLLHGGGQTRRSWNDRGYVDRLSGHFTVITVDLRGSGDSDKPATAEAYALDRLLEDLLAVADVAKAPRFHLWGFGHGASIGRYLAARSERVISAVLVAASMGPTVTGIVKDAIVGMRAKWQPLIDAHKAGTLDLKSLSPGDRAAWDNGVAVSALALGALTDYPPLEPSEVKVPTLWLVGNADAAAMENVKEYQGKLAGTKVTLAQIDGLSYSDSFAKVEPVLAKVEPFLASHR